MPSLYGQFFHSKQLGAPYDVPEEHLLDLIRLHLMSVEQIDRLGDHLHVPQLLGGNVQKEILDFWVLDAKALGHILHGCFQFAVSAA